MNTLSVRELKKEDVEQITNYWLNASEEYLKSMGADIHKLPSREQWQNMLSEQIGKKYEEKKSYAIIWEMDGIACGHSNVNKIIFAEEASMHLHLWNAESRKKGSGVELVKMSVPYFFKNLQLKKLFCEPYALNAAPNKTLEKAGFTFVKEYTTIPGYINFEQPVKLWELDKEQFSQWE